MSSFHHGVEGTNEEEKKRQDEVMKRLLDQFEGRAKREYLKGRIGADDEGSLAMAVSADIAHGTVVISFGKSVEWIGMDAEQAIGLAKMLIEKARQVSKEPLVMTI